MSRSLDWSVVRAALEALQRSVADDIRAYPAPIPACDAQFNHLLELRRALPQEIERLEAEIAAVEDILHDPNLYTRDPGRFAELTERSARLRGETNAAEERWLEVAEMAEAIEWADAQPAAAPESLFDDVYAEAIR